MRVAVRVAPLLVSVVCTTGCLSSSTLVKLKLDGSGTIEHTLLMNVNAFERAGGTIAKALGAEAQAEAASTPPQSIDDLLKRADFQKAAARLGRGVRFVSSTPLSRGGMQGAEIVFAFDDINHVAIAPVGVGAATAGEDGGGEAVFRLARSPGGLSVLTIDMPDGETGHTAPAGREAPEAGVGSQPQAQVPPEMIEMMKQMMAGLRFDLAVEVEGRLVRTSSEYIQESRVTILELDFDQLVQQPDALQSLPALTRGADMAQARHLLKDVKGLKFAEPPITIEFSAP